MFLSVLSQECEQRDEDVACGVRGLVGDGFPVPTDICRAGRITDRQRLGGAGTLSGRQTLYPHLPNPLPSLVTPSFASGFLLCLTGGMLALIVVSSMGAIMPTKTYSIIMVSPIDHVTMNHQNQT
jgi:hypothetical protein